MRMPRNAALALAAAALLAPRPAAPQVALGARAFGGYNTYAMGDREDIERGLRVPPGSLAVSDDGYSLGVGAELAWGLSLAVTASYERLVPGRMSEVNGEKLRLPANALLFEAEYRRRLRPRIRVGVGAGGGYYQLGEETESPGTGRNFEGGAFGSQAFGLGEWDLTSTTSIGLDVGYRWASVAVSKVNRQPPSFDINVDYSGLHTRLVLRFHPRGAR